MAGIKSTINIDIQDVLKEGTTGYERCQRLRSRVIAAQSRICIERARIITKSYQETEGEHILMRRAKAFDKILRGMSVYILGDELIVGHQSSKQRSAPLFPEFAVEWVAEEINTFATRAQDKFAVSEEIIKEYREEIVPYWKGKTLFDRVISHMSDEIKLQRFDANVFSLGLHEDGGLGHVLMDYEKVLRTGLSGIKKEIQAKIGSLKPWDPDSLKKTLFYNSSLMMCDSFIHFANRYAAEARRLAEIEECSERKQELILIANNCAKVPEFPAESFFEALQSLWFIQLVPQIYDNGVSITPGRFDQYMYPYYEKDLAEGVLTKEKAQELLEVLWVKFTEPIKVYRALDAAIHAGYPMGQNLVVGGIGPDGNDATNDLSYRCLEAHTHMLLMQPNFSVRVHNKTPHDFLIRVSEAIKMGNGMPQLMNDEVFIPALMNIGVNLTDARDYAPVGCVENTPLHTWGRCNGGYFNLTKIVELALNDGVCRISGKQVGPKTGNPNDFNSFEDVIAAYKTQMNYAVNLSVTLNNIIDMVHEDLMPVPHISILVGNCIENGKDVTSGGAKYNWTAPLGIGIANAGDSLVAVKKMVFDEQVLTMAELVDALNSNFFEGKEDIRQTLLNKAPKFGNDDPEADGMVKLATDIFFDSLMGHETYRGGPFVASMVPVASYVAFGFTTASTPDGRRTGDPLADGISPSNGADRNGPTAVFKSVCTIDHVRCPNGVIFNQKFSPGPLSTLEGLKKFSSLIRSYVNLGGGHIQFNIVSAETLKEAQKHPEKYRGLVVRVAGYSAFFHELSKEVQDTIIERTEQCL